MKQQNFQPCPRVVRSFCKQEGVCRRMELKGHGTTGFVPPAQVPLTEFAIPAVAATGGRTFISLAPHPEQTGAFFFLPLSIFFLVNRMLPV